MQEPRGEDMTIERGESDPSDSPRHEWRDTAEETIGRAREDARRAKEQAAEKLRRAGRRVSQAYDRAASGAERALRGTRSYVRDNPGVAVAVGFAAGVGVGAMLAPRRRPFAYRSGLVPLVAVALANAVLEVFEPGS
jgi:ElaB/YqjD/DUF883 family membrane-anchored ribosome-binding protein